MSISVYLEQLAGFCLILLPLALLLFLPFERTRRRFSTAGLVLLLTILAGACAVLPLLAGGRGLGSFLFLAILALCLIFYLLIRDDLTRKSAVLFSALFCLKAQAILAIGYEAVRDLMSGAQAEPGLNLHGDTDLMLLLAAAVLFPMLIVFERRVLMPCLRTVTRRMIWMELLLLAIADLVIYFLAFFFVGMFTAVAGEMGNVPGWGVVPGLLLFLLALFAVYVFTFRTTLFHARETEIRLQTELLRENSLSLQREMERSRRIHHDLRQLLRQMRALGENGELAELDPYMERIVSLTEHTETVFCENKCLNALFQYYTGCANEKGIPMHISAICREVSVEDADLTLLTANALENAITGAEEFRAQTGRKPEIQVIVGVIRHRLLLQITNPCCSVRYAPEILQKDRHTLLPAHAFLSTHEKGGYGLQRIDRIAEAYQGTARFQFDEEKSLWMTRIAIPNHQEKKDEENHENRNL